MSYFVNEAFMIGILIIVTYFIFMFLNKSKAIELDKFQKQGIILSVLILLILRMLNYSMNMQQAQGEIMAYEGDPGNIGLDFVVSLIIGFGISYIKNKVIWK